MPSAQSEELKHQPPKAPSGTLYVVGTPIGNLEDITLRALRILKEVDLVACEDTRHTQKLLEHYSILTRTISYHEHNELTRAPELIIQLEAGTHVALVSDAGMPGISDPGYRLIHLAIRHGIAVVPVPGAAAFVAALSASGMNLDSFHFIGFLPSKRLARRAALKMLENDAGTLVFYESPHRVAEMLGDALAILGDRPVVVAREVTKLHEEFLRGPISTIQAHLSKHPVKGEITILVGPSEEPKRRATDIEKISEEIREVMTSEGLDERDALKSVAKRRGISKSEVYRQWQADKSRVGKS